MAKHTVQQAPAGAPIVVIYFCAYELFERMREAVGPGVALIIFDSRATEPLDVTLDGLGGGRVCIAGFSAGCQDVRAALWAGHDVDAVVCIDGTHASLPPHATQLAVWSNLAGQARRGERLFVATCSGNVYTESLAPGQRFMSTRSVLRIACALDLDDGEDEPAGYHDGALHVYNYRSAPTDRAAHAQQLRKVMPVVFERHVRLWLFREESAPCGLTDADKSDAAQAVAAVLDRIVRKVT